MRRRILLACAFAAWLPSVPKVFADATTFTVGPSQSVLVLSGTFGGNQLQPLENLVSPPPDSFTASYGGTISVTIDPATGALQITGAQITAANGGNYPPPLPSPSAANYGGYNILSQPSLFYTGFEMAMRGLSISLSGPAITSPASFDVSNLSVAVASGELDYARFFSELPVGLFTSGNETSSDEIGLGGESLALSSATGGLSSAGGVETLSIPVETNLGLEVDGIPLDLSLSGTIVATAVPEPAGLSVLAVALLLLVRRR